MAELTDRRPFDPPPRPDAPGRPWRPLVHRWPLDRNDLGRFVGAYLALTAVFTGLGLLVVGPFEGSIGGEDQRVAERLVDGRTPRLDDLSHWGSMLSATSVKIVLTAVVVAVLLTLWRRWEDVLLITTSLVLEASAFITITFLVGRPRPDVPRLEDSPVDSSFPSGHVAAAVVYGALTIVVARHSRRSWPVVLTAVCTASVVAVVAWSRMYRGMHHLSDVIAGVVLGLLSLWAAWSILRRAEDRTRT